MVEDVNIICVKTRNGGRIVEVEGFIDGSRVVAILANGRVSWWQCSICKSARKPCVHVNRLVRGV